MAELRNKRLKVLIGYCLVTRTNTILNSLALNHWSLKKKGAPWDFPDEIAIVTGGSSGFGKLMTERLAPRLKRVIVLDVQDKPKEFEDNPQIAFYKCDISKKSELQQVAATLRQEHGSPSILINNAGIVAFYTVLDTPEQYLRKVFEVNTFSHWFTVQEFLPDMLKSRKGHVVEIDSMASYVSTVKLSAYCGTKSAVLAFRESLNQELHHEYENGRYIQTTSVHPTWANTPLLRDDVKQSLAACKTKVLAVETVADAVAKQVLSGRGGDVFVPSSGALFSGVRGWANWIQEALRAGG